MSGPALPPEWNDPGGRAPRSRVPGKRRGRRTALRVTLLVIVPLLVLLAAAAVFAGPTVADIAREQSVRVETPANAGGMAKGSDPKVLNELEAIEGDFDTNVKAYYEDGGQPVVVWGGTTLLVFLDQQFDSFYKAVEEDGATVTDRAPVAAGSVGGRMECAKMTTRQEGTNGLCVWLNHGALLAFLSPDRTPPERMGTQARRMLPDMVTRD